MNDFVLPKLEEIIYLAGVNNAPPITDILVDRDLSLPSVEDGDMVTLFTRDLTIASGCTLTVTDRCKGLRIFCFGDCTIDGTLSMTARGAHAAGEDVTLDIATMALFTVKFPGEMRAIDHYLKNFFTPASNFTDMPYSIRPVLSKSFITGQTVGTIASVGGDGGAALTSGSANGNPGQPGTNRSCGGGGGGGRYIYGTNDSYSGAGAKGTSFCGGAGGGGAGCNNSSYRAYAGSGAAFGGAGGYGSAPATNAAGGGGAGNPGGSGGSAGSYVGYAGSSGAGGLIILTVTGNLNISPSGSIVSRGSAGGSTSSASAYTAGGGGSGGGSVNIAHGGSYVNGGTISVAGGAGGIAGKSGGAGGAGSITIDQLSI